MKKLKSVLFTLVLFGLSCNQTTENNTATDYDKMMVRIAEIEIAPEFIEEYLAILKEESEASIRLESGVICIYPMYQKEYPTEIRLLEIYASKSAYESHLQSPHFQKYKETTLPMVKELRLVDMQAIDPASMPKIFVKLGH